MARRALVCGFVACAIAFPNVALGKAIQPLCEGRGLTVDVGFARGGAHACSITRARGQLRLNLQIRPEVEPSNPSPWYSVRVNARRGEPLTLNLDYGRYNHRYHPHTATQIGQWTRLAPHQVIVGQNKSQAEIRFDLQAGTNFIAAQPFDPVIDMTAALDAKVATGTLSRTVFGQSKAGIPFISYQTSTPKAEGTLILLTRQHPPGVAGEWAFDAFVEVILGDDPAARALRNRFNILILPNLNPDGIARGFWRANGGLIDLNRDWGPFTQPETSAAAAHIIAATAQAPPIAMMDFHATNRDVIYAQPLSATVTPAGLVDRWLAAWRDALGERAPSIDRAHNASNANSKTWARIQFGIGAITYEVGDNTARATAEDNARLAARLFIVEALALPAQSASPISSTNGATP